MKTTIRLKLNKDRQLRCGRYPLVFQIIHRRQRRLIYTGIKVLEESFDMEKERVVYFDKEGFKRGDVSMINEQLAAARCNIVSMTDYLAFTTESFTAEDISQLHHRRLHNRYVLTFAEGLIAERLSAGRYGTAKNYRYTVNALQCFAKSDQLRFEDIDYRFLKNYELSLQNRNLKSNSIVFYIRNLRAIYNKALEDGVFELPPGGSPFDKITVRTSKTVKRALPIESIRKIMQVDLVDRGDLKQSRDYFMFSFYTRGMSFVDMVNLRRSDIHNNIIHYFRAKTKTLIKVGVTEQLQAIIDKYRSESSYVLPCLSDDKTKQQNYSRYRTVLAWHNRNLKEIAAMIELDTALTTYVARHSWATTAKEKGIPVAVISESLGHSTENITNIYLKSFDQDILDDANRQVSLL